MKKKYYGFTLIELLVVIAIIGVITTLAVIAFGKVRVKSRDAKRMSDLLQISKALDLYYADQNYYPTIITPGQPLTSPNGSTTYLAKIPSNPTPRTDEGAPDLDYVYSIDNGYAGNNIKYNISTSIATPVNNISPGRIAISGLNGSGGEIFSCGQMITDRDGYTYNTVQVGSQCWMKENLKTKTKPNGEALTNSIAGNEVIGSERTCPAEGCSTDPGSEEDCNTWGAGYTWDGAMAGQTAAGSQGICPVGWHIPTDAEWNEMEQSLTDFDEGRTCNANRNGGWDCSFAGDKSKTLADCAFPAYNHCAETNFNALMSGARDKDGETFCTGIYNKREEMSLIWTSSMPQNLGECAWCNPVEDFAWHRAFAWNTEKTQRMGVEKTYTHSVRCIKD